ncbi:autotransporter assembly complex protein TamA [Spiribacter halobius]|uniref:Translocation and assembly module subunit TamA n=1 Tax=Sediminicurvatus halobius TaxID=2182432 RepID=A0A2U2MYZ6_9GAMM|nr:autotransporter assembly complex family protein [Spiribacter halobius]PWG62156.1 outer membrane protein assembly factor [Spiribacter halobius]UEX77157.1 autotransporter assembly complex protein TamA [Spiribacter halobius]
MRRSTRPTVVLLLALALLPAPAAAAPVELVLSGVEGEAAENVRAYVDTEVDLETALAARTYRNRSREQVRQALEALGYYQASIEVDIERGEEAWTLRVAVEPGERVNVRAVQVSITGDAVDDPAFSDLRERLPVREGEPLNHGAYERSKSALRNLALSRGYFEHRFTDSRIAVNPGAGWAEIRLAFDSGPRYRLGEVRFSDSPFRASLLRRFVPFDEGDPYEAGAIAELNRRLLDSGYFDNVVVNTRRGEAEDLRIPIDAELTARPDTTVSTGIGFSTDEGPRLRLTGTRHYINDRGHSLVNDLRVSQVRQNVSSRYQIPLRDPLNDRLELRVGWQREDIEDTESERYTAGLSRRQQFRSGWTRTQSLRWLDERFEQGEDEGRTTLLLPGLSFSRTRSRGGLDPYWGDRQDYGVELASEALLSDVDIFRITASNHWLRSFGERHRLQLRAELGGIGTNDFSQVPSSLRFFAGGDRSVRGYAYQSLAPEDDEGELLGGRYLATGSIEYSFRLLPDWRLAAFTDAGNAFDEPGNVEAKVGSGFGVRWLSPVGPVRLDLAWGVSEENVPFRVHISVGPPF